MPLTTGAASRSILNTEVRLGSLVRDDRRISLLADLAVAAVIAIAFWYQVSATRDRALSPDEALHFGLVNLPGPLEVYRRAWSNAHPPLFFFALYFWMHLGRSELFLRLLPAVFGAIFLWLVYRWASRAFGKASGFLTFFVLIFAPIWLPLSGELRHYTLMLMCFAAALGEFEVAVEKRSRERMVVSFAFLYLAILSHYSVLFLAATFAVYGWIRLRCACVPRRMIVVWSGCQTGAAALYAFLYFTHVKNLRGSAMEGLAMSGWLRSGYLHRSQETALGFVIRQAGDVVHCLFGRSPAPVLAIFLTVAGVLLLVWRRQPGAVLLSLPVVFGATAGLLGLYPFTGTRHSVYLLPFFSAAIGVALSALVGGRLWAALLIALVLAPLYRTVPEWPTPAHSRSSIDAAITQLRRSVPEGAVLFTDYRTGPVLSFYLDRREFNNEKPGLEGFFESDVGGYCVVRSSLWTPGPRALADEVKRFVSDYRFSPGQRFWAIRGGGEFDITRALSQRFPGSVYPLLSGVGGLSVAEIWPWSDPEPTSLSWRSRRSHALRDDQTNRLGLSRRGEVLSPWVWASRVSGE